MNTVLMCCKVVDLALAVEINGLFCICGHYMSGQIGPTYIHTMHLLTDGADTFITSRTKYIVRICLLLYPLPTMVHFHKKMTK